MGCCKDSGISLLLLPDYRPGLGLVFSLAGAGVPNGHHLLFLHERQMSYPFLFLKQGTHDHCGGNGRSVGRGESQ